MSLLGQKLRFLRQQRGTTQKAVAAYLELTSHVHITKVEAGQRGVSLKNILLLADYYGVTMQYLIDDATAVEEVEFWDGPSLTNHAHPTQQLGAKIHYLRAQQSLSQTETARQLGLSSHAVISNIEAGRKAITPALLMNICKVLRTSPDILVRDEVVLTSGTR